MRRIKAWLGGAPEPNPVVLWVCVFVAIGLIPSAIGAEPLPGSLRRLGQFLGQYAAAMTVVGCILTSVGILLWHRDRGIRLELAGSILIVVSISVYAYAIWLVAGPSDRAYAFWSCVGLAVGFSFRVAQIMLYVETRREAART